MCPDDRDESSDASMLDYARAGDDRETTTQATYFWIATAFATCLAIACSVDRTLEPLRVFVLVISSMAACVLAICLGLVAFACGLGGMWRWFERRRLRRTLGLQQRLIGRQQARQLLLHGRGTLILEEDFHSGHDEWWTPDDVIAKSPVELPSAATQEQLFRSHREFPIALHAYGKLCVLRYTDPRRGSAKQIEPSLFVFARDAIQWPRSPDARIVTLISWLRRPVIFHGAVDAPKICQR